MTVVDGRDGNPAERATIDIGTGGQTRNGVTRIGCLGNVFGDAGEGTVCCNGGSVGHDSRQCAGRGTHPARGADSRCGFFWGGDIGSNSCMFQWCICMCLCCFW